MKECKCGDAAKKIPDYRRSITLAGPKLCLVAFILIVLHDDSFVEIGVYL